MFGTLRSGASRDGGQHSRCGVQLGSVELIALPVCRASRKSRASISLSPVRKLGAIPALFHSRQPHA